MRSGFVDTNVLVYAATGRADEHDKWRIAHETLEAAPHSLSGQVLAEFYTIATKKHRLPIEQANAWMEHLQGFPCQPIDRDVVLMGVLLAQRYQISYWDAALIAASRRLGISVLYTEDLSHGQSYDGVQVINPFKS